MPKSFEVRHFISGTKPLFVGDKGVWVSVHWSDYALLLTMNLMALRVQLRHEELESIGIWEPAAE